MYSFDKVLDQRIKTGFYQNSTIFILGLVEFHNGLEYVFITFLMTLLKAQWNLDQIQLSTLGSAFFAGIVGGNLLCAKISDTIGRNLTFQIFCGLSVLMIYLSSLAQNFTQMVFLRFMFGLMFGTTSPLCYVVISEVALTKYRGRDGLVVTLLYVMGKIYFIVLCYIFLDGYDKGNWRALMRVNGIPFLIAFILSLLILRETARFRLIKGQYCMAFQEIMRAELLNNGPCHPLTQLEKDGLILWAQHLNELNFKNDQKGGSILSKKYLKLTLLLWGMIILVSFQNICLFLLMPFLLQHHNHSFSSLFYLFIAEFICQIFVFLFIDNPNYGGRIRILKISAFIILFSNIALFIFQQNFLLLALLVMKIGCRTIFSIVYIVTCESFPIHLRSRSFGIAKAMGRIATIPSPYIIFPIFNLNPYLPFAVLALLSIIQILLIYSYPYDRTQRPLEISDDESSDQESETSSKKLKE